MGPCTHGPMGHGPMDPWAHGPHGPHGPMGPWALKGGPYNRSGTIIYIIVPEQLYTYTVPVCKPSILSWLRHPLTFCRPTEIEVLRGGPHEALSKLRANNLLYMYIIVPEQLYIIVPERLYGPPLRAHGPMGPWGPWGPWAHGPLKGTTGPWAPKRDYGPLGPL